MLLGPGSDPLLGLYRCLRLIAWAVWSKSFSDPRVAYILSFVARGDFLSTPDRVAEPAFRPLREGSWPGTLPAFRGERCPWLTGCVPSGTLGLEGDLGGIGRGERGGEWGGPRITSARSYMGMSREF